MANHKKAEADRQKVRNITLSDNLAFKARAIGAGNLSAGIRVAIEEYLLLYWDDCGSYTNDDNYDLFGDNNE